MTGERTALIVGASRPESLETSYARALGKLGWSIERWNPREALRRAVRGGRLGAALATFVHVEPWVRKANVELLQAVERLRPRLVLIIATSGVRAGTLAQCRVLSPESRIYMIYPDSPHGMDADRIACLRACHRVAASTRPWARALLGLGAPRTHFVPFAADTALYDSARAPAQASRRWDVGFIGTWRPEREEALERFSDFRLAVWGGKYWSRRTNPGGSVRGNWRGHELIGEEVVRACAETRVMLNILDPITWPGPNMRSFELPACRAFVLSQRTPEILEFFREGEEIECFDSLDEARDKARHYLSNDAARERIAARGYERVVNGGETYADRAQTILGWLAEDA
ncbi:MAG TPA: glycosyltransferase [Usitatibacter sp.]|nr:glycosyltransferase [Usitatibacter sp.]